MSKARPVLVANLLEGNSSILDSGWSALLDLSKVQFVSGKEDSSVSNLLIDVWLLHKRAKSKSEHLLHNIGDSLRVSCGAGPDHGG